jgi:hypothetical protein
MRLSLTPEQALEHVVRRFSHAEPEGLRRLQRSAS